MINNLRLDEFDFEKVCAKPTAKHDNTYEAIQWLSTKMGPPKWLVWIRVRTKPSDGG